MLLIQLPPKIPAQANHFKKFGVQALVRKISQIVNGKAIVEASKKIKREHRKLALHKVISLSAKQINLVLGLVRIQLEEIKRKVRAQSPAALQFIGPGDSEKNPFKERG